MDISIDEAPDGSQSIKDGKLLIGCDCNYTDPCLQGKPMGSNRCCIRVDAKRLKKKERKRLISLQR